MIKQAHKHTREPEQIATGVIPEAICRSGRLMNELPMFTSS